MDLNELQVHKSESRTPNQKRGGSRKPKREDSWMPFFIFWVIGTYAPWNDALVNMFMTVWELVSTPVTAAYFINQCHVSIPESIRQVDCWTHLSISDCNKWMGWRCRKMLIFFLFLFSLNYMWHTFGDHYLKFWINKWQLRYQIFARKMILSKNCRAVNVIVARAFDNLSVPYCNAKDTRKISKDIFFLICKELFGIRS